MVCRTPPPSTHNPRSRAPERRSQPGLAEQVDSKGVFHCRIYTLPSCLDCSACTLGLFSNILPRCLSAWDAFLTCSGGFDRRLGPK